MRGPLLVGPIGNPVTLDRVAALVRDKGPALVLSEVWLAAELATELPVTLLCEPEARRSAKRALKKAATAGQKLAVVVAGETLPVPPGAAGAIVVEGLADTDEEDAIEFLLDLGASLSADGIVVALDGTKDPTAEARVAGFFLAAGLRGIEQERPREGAVLTCGRAPLAEAIAARPWPSRAAAAAGQAGAPEAAAAAIDEADKGDKADKVRQDDRDPSVEISLGEDDDGPPGAPPPGEEPTGAFEREAPLAADEPPAEAPAEEEATARLPRRTPEEAGAEPPGRRDEAPGRGGEGPGGAGRL